MLEDEGVLDMVTIGEYKLGFVPLDSDILSLEMMDLYHEVTPPYPSTAALSLSLTHTSSILSMETPPLSALLFTLYKNFNLYLEIFLTSNARAQPHGRSGPSLLLFSSHRN